MRRLNALQALREVAVELERNNGVVIALGGPGTGKTFVADYVIRVAVGGFTPCRLASSPAACASTRTSRWIPGACAPHVAL